MNCRWPGLHADWVDDTDVIEEMMNHFLEMLSSDIQEIKLPVLDLMEGFCLLYPKTLDILDHREVFEV